MLANIIFRFILSYRNIPSFISTPYRLKSNETIYENKNQGSQYVLSFFFDDKPVFIGTVYSSYIYSDGQKGYRIIISTKNKKDFDEYKIYLKNDSKSILLQNDTNSLIIRQEYLTDNNENSLNHHFNTLFTASRRKSYYLLISLMEQNEMYLIQYNHIDL